MDNEGVRGTAQSYTQMLGALSQEEGGAQPTVVVGVVQDKHRDPGYWVSAGRAGRVVQCCDLAFCCSS